MSPKKVVIVGAGPGGLAAAMQLAHAGCDVTILEQKQVVGGRTSAIERDGFRFDCGPTFFLYPRVLSEIFSSVGFELAEEVPMQRLDPQYRITFGGGGQLDCTPNLETMEAQIAQLNPKDVGAFERYLSDNRIKLEKFRPILESPFNTIWDLLRPSVLAALPNLHPTRSLGQELQRYFSDPRLVIAFGFQAKYLGMSPFKCPSLFSILSFLEYEYGVWHPIGGCSRVSEKMADLAQSLGVRLRLAEPVHSVDIVEGRLVAVESDQRRYEADAFVVNADFADWITRTVPDHLRTRWKNDRIENKKFSCSTFMLYLGIEGLYQDLPHHNIHISRDYEKNLTEIEKTHVLGDAPSFYVQNAGVTDPSLAPPGCSTLYVLVPVTHQHENVDWKIESDRYRELVLDRMSQIGLSDVRQRIRFEHRITPADWQRDYCIYRGATFNLAHHLSQMLHLRPKNRFDELDGLYLVGGGTHPGSGLPVIYESSRITTRLLLEDLGMRS
ncbi:phytoene desaturase family protein [Novipirellula artificiosorum]|uniref:All-trans-zeta-carotene desaturase n=1 Tax=Novipirellula artificiosorum TaxID=2528016 RepID=A0A5C6E039_9BACT|nr:phytoene desaturase family protein [Novipirellula artificiosorum]TWU41844.1 All-trans-zeta-carotene desaturase [Novipirellula artificiosorum]